MDPENAAFWLPSHFLTDDDDFLSDNLHHRTNTFNKHHSFDKHNNFDAFSLSLDSPVSSTETERGDSSPNDDDDDFLADLTRHLAQSSLLDPTTNEKPWVFSTSPQSTLSGFGPCSNNRSGFSSNGSPNGPSQVPSPPVTPPAKNDAAWELLYEAAGQVARLKMNALAAQIHHHNHQQHNRGGLLAQPRNVSLSSKPQLNSFYDFPPTNQYEEVKRQRSGNFYCQHHNHNHHQQRRSCGGGPLGLPQSAWPPLRPNHHRQPNNGPAMPAVFLNGPGSGPMPGLKRQSTGTGVFLPRRAGTTTHQPAPPPEPRKKTTGCSPVLLPARVVHALNLDLEEMNNVNSQQSRFSSGRLSEHDIMMARRNAILEQQRRNTVRNEGTATMVGHEIRLPSDWTY